MKQVMSWKSLMIVAVLVGLAAAFTGSAVAQEAPPQSLTVSGFGQAFGAPDIAHVQMGVQVTNEDVLAAFDDANTRMQAVLDALREAGVEDRDLQTTGLYMYQESIFDPQTGAPSDNSLYRVGNTVNVTVRDITQVSAIINAGVEAGANNINSLTFGIADQTELEDEARAAAVEDARARAQKLADLAGVTLGSPTIIIEENLIGIPLPLAADRAFGGAASVPVEEGQLSVNLTVRVTFSIS